jgi:trehalose utilization protein
MDASPRETRLAVVIGAHPLEALAFSRLFRELPGIDATIQTLEDWVADMGGPRASGFYDVVLFYNFHQEEPPPAGSTWLDIATAIESLRTAGTGVLVLHHAILAYPTWSTWGELVGIDDRSFSAVGMETLPFAVAAEHPITEGVTDWQMVDEPYTMNDAGPGSEVLLTVDHPTSMRTIGWVRSFGQARVFCLQSGHDHTSFDDPNFRRVLQQGIRWLADHDD